LAARFTRTEALRAPRCLTGTPAVLVLITDLAIACTFLAHLPLPTEPTAGCPRGAGADPIGITIPCKNARCSAPLE